MAPGPQVSVGPGDGRASVRTGTSGLSRPTVDDRSKPSPSDRASARSRAIAIKREPESEARPRVVAKGEGELAEQILAIAFERDIKVRTDVDLAEILSAVEVESEIPLEALAAVAEILSYVYRANQGHAHQGAGRPAATPTVAEEQP